MLNCPVFWHFFDSKRAPTGSNLNLFLEIIFWIQTSCKYKNFELFHMFSFSCNFDQFSKITFGWVITTIVFKNDSNAEALKIGQLKWVLALSEPSHLFYFKREEADSTCDMPFRLFFRSLKTVPNVFMQQKLLIFHDYIRQLQSI